MAVSILETRQAGLLLHPSSLPKASLGKDAYRFIDFLVASGLSIWQVLPIGPTHSDGSPYQTLSVHAGNLALIDLLDLEQLGWLSIDNSLSQYQNLSHAFQGFQQQASQTQQQQFQQFQRKHQHWLADYALYQACKQQYQNQPWWLWPVSIRLRQLDAIQQHQQQLADSIKLECFIQFIFFQQWLKLKSYANQHKVQIFGDMPIFVAYDSADVWAYQQGFLLDEQGQLRVVAGVPPDYFSATGQRWGNPLYNWQVLEANDFLWWKQRLATQLLLFDWVRIDHFRGFEAYWEIPAENDDARSGRWIKAPGDKLFASLQQYFPKLPLIAEDLGVITPEVEVLRCKYRLPGMKVLQFAFDHNPHNVHLPYHYQADAIVYTGTHDNNTSLGWFLELPPEQQHYTFEYLGRSSETMPWPLIRCAFASVASWAIIPMQDILELDAQHRMNTPGTVLGNWQWQFQWQQISVHLAERVRYLVTLYGRH